MEKAIEADIVVARDRVGDAGAGGEGERFGRGFGFAKRGGQDEASVRKGFVRARGNFRPCDGSAKHGTKRQQRDKAEPDHRAGL